MPLKPPFETLVESHSAEIFGYLWRMLSDSDEAEDCLQETFLRAYRAYPRLQSTSSLRAWLYRIATNVARTRLKRRLRIAAHTTDLDPDLLQGGPSAPARYEHQQALAAIAVAVDTLPTKQRAALVMRKYQEMEYADIALALDCSQAAARAHVYQALKKLRTRFASRPQETAYGNEDNALT
jgi:RNA polymerase sigma-70 factor (ECF subfamily)